MPYIPPGEGQRKELDPLIDELAERIVAMAKRGEEGNDFEGPLNYTCTRLGLKILKLLFGRFRYKRSPVVRGVFHDVASEFYRRLMGPYEDKQIEKNGDVDLYAEFLEEINK